MRDGCTDHKSLPRVRSTPTLHPSAIPIVAVLSMLLASCSATATDDARVRSIEDTLAGEVTVEADPSGTVANLRVATTIPWRSGRGGGRC